MTASSFRLRIQSDTAPENTFVMFAMASATPSMNPTTSVEAPRLVTRNTGRSAWIISDEMSMNRLTIPSAQMPRGIRRDTGCGRRASFTLPPVRTSGPQRPQPVRNDDQARAHVGEDGHPQGRDAGHGEYDERGLRHD